MSKPWEMRLSIDQIEVFKQVLENLKKRGISSRCPFNPYLCVRVKPNCDNFVKGLKRNDGKTKTVCPCYKFRTKSLIWRIEALLRYNKEKNRLCTF